MLIFILSKYLESHKRLVVPQLGAFLVKEPGVSIVFSELMKRDDGVLRGLLRQEGMGELEAAGEIDRFVFEVRHAVEHGRTFNLEGFGVMTPGPNATIVFEYRPAPAADDAPVAPRKEESAATESAAEQTDRTAAATGSKGRSTIRTDKVAEAVEAAFADPHVSPSVKMNPEPYVRGLKYGKPRKTTDAYRYVDRAPRRRRFDRFLLLAIIAAGIAVAAIAFGYWRDLREKEAEAAATEQMQPVPGPNPPAEASAERTLPDGAAPEERTTTAAAQAESASAANPNQTAQ